MNFKDMLAKITTLSEATKETPTGKVHKAEPGGYGRKFDTDEEGEEKKKEAPAAKRGRGRPKKGSDETGEVKKYDWSAFGVKSGKDVKLPKYDKSKTTKHSLKEYFDELDAQVIAEMVPSGMRPIAILDPKNKQAGAGVVTSKNPAIQKMLGGLDPKDVQIVMTQQQPGTTQPAAGATGQAPVGQQPVREKWDTETKVSPEEKGKYAGKGKAELLKAYNALKKSGPHKKGSPEFGKMRELAFAIRAKSDWGKVAEADLPPQDSMASPLTLEGKKPDFLDLDKDGNKKESMKKAASDAKKDKKKIDEGIMDKIKSFAVPKLMNMLGADKAAEIANTVKQVTGGDFTPSKENAIKVAKAFGFDKMQPPGGKGQEQQMAEGIAGNWQGKLIQLMYSLGLLGTAAGAATFWGTVGGTWLAAVGALILTFAGTFFSSEKGMVGAMGREGRKGTDTGVTDFSEQQSKKDKKKVDEGMEHRHKAARHAGKAHALSKEGYNCRYDDMEEMRAYHEGYKEGLDECYGQGVYETAPAATVPGMAQQAMPAMEADVEEGNAFTAALAKTPKGGKFSVGGKTFTDRTNYDAKVTESPFAFEAWDNQLNELLNEGMSVSVSTGQPGMPESVSVNATDGDADKLLAFVKQVGLGGLGAEQQPSNYGAPTAGSEVAVVDDHDDMMSLIKKMTGGEGPAGQDYADEEGHGEEGCEVCGEAGCGGHEDKEVVDEVESEDQMTYEVAEDNAPDSDEAETSADENAEAEEDAALAKADELSEFLDVAVTQKGLGTGGSGGSGSVSGVGSTSGSDATGGSSGASSTSSGNQTSQDASTSSSSKSQSGAAAGKGNTVTNEWANDAGKDGTDTTFEQDIDFMTRVIAGGLNKEKSTGQTTIPVIAGQTDRMGTVNESKDSLTDWLKLSGVK